MQWKVFKKKCVYICLPQYQKNNAVLEIINCTVTYKIVQKTQQFSFWEAKVRKICIKFCPEIFFHLLLQIHEYYLGNGFKTTSPFTATNEFMKREFKDILNFLEKPHDVILIPDAFQYGSAAKKLKTKKDECCVLPPGTGCCALDLLVKILFLPFFSCFAFVF